MTKILLLNTWIRNIGNGFIDKGAEVCVRNTIDDAEIIEVSGYPDRTGYYNSLGVMKQFLVGFGLKVQKKRRYYAINQQSTVNVSEFIDDIDLAILSGCVLDWSLFAYKLTLKKLRNRGIPLIFLGAGGADYTDTAQNYVSKIIDELQPTALLTRDKKAYDLYSKYFRFAYNGIDCGFFINEWYNPPESCKPFVVATFDAIKEPKLGVDLPIVRADHEPFNFSDMKNIILRSTVDLMKCSKKQNILISDNIKDYLFIYANAKEVHSDRVHACVAALSYGNKTRLYSKTPRAALFNNVLNSDITKNVVSIDAEILKQKKSNQISALREAIKTI